MGMSSYENENVVWNRAALKELVALATDDTGAAGPLDGTLSRFSVSTITVNKDTTLAAMGTLAALGDSTVPVTWSPVINLDNDRVALKAQIEAVAGADPDLEELTGVVIVNAAEDDWICFYKFPAAAPIEIEGDGVTVDLALPFSFNVAGW